MIPGLPSPDGRPTELAFDVDAEFYQVPAARVVCPCGAENNLLGQGAALLRKRGTGVSMRCSRCGARLNLHTARVSRLDVERLVCGSMR